MTSLDTKAVAAGQCSIVLRMARLPEKDPDWEMPQAVQAAEELIRRSRMCFVPKDIRYLRAGGRVSNTAALCGDLLGIHPLIEIQDGHLAAAKKLRGKLDKLAPRLVEEYTAKNNLCRDELWLIRAPGLPENVQEAAERTAYRCGFQKVTWVNTGGVITTHGGPGAFGVAGFSQT